MTVTIGIIGLGYVGLPVALAFAKKFPNTVGFDINKEKIAKLKEGRDETNEVSEAELKATSITFTTDPKTLSKCNFFVIAVPTPIDSFKKPDLTPLISASKVVGKIVSKGATIVFESTVYPGVTEDICGKIIATESGLVQGKDFKLGYSPERINPGDKEHTIEKIVKVVSGEDQESLKLISSVYGKIIDAGVYEAESIKVAEAAKVIENTQRDLNIALMNELSLIFDRMGIRTLEVLKAAGTKWNFLPFRPGLVGGHCIGVDPYYLTTKAEELGYIPEVILAGRRINDSMGEHVANRTIKLMLKNGFDLAKSKVTLLGLTFKENVPDIRNSRVPDIIAELKQYNVLAEIIDPVAAPHEALEEYGLEIKSSKVIPQDTDVCILAVPHKETVSSMTAFISNIGKNKKLLLIDVKSAIDPKTLPSNVIYWSL
jgi:UDP-N-acetyl-D-galactosamine dehydrogenase